MATRQAVRAVAVLAMTLLVAAPAARAASSYQAVWTRADSGPWLVWEATAFAPTTGRLVVFGGSRHGAGARRETHLFDPGRNTWTTLAVRKTDPTARVEARMVWDPDAQRIVMFGGRDARGASLQDTWAFDPRTNTWSALISNCRRQTCPAARWGHGVVWSSVLHRVLVYGGVSSGTAFDDLWSFDGRSWTRIATPTGPAARYLMGMAEDPGTGLVMVYGGTATEPGYSDTWIFDPAHRTWSSVQTATVPDVRAEVGMAWLPSINRIVISSGTDATGCQGRTNSTWAYDPGLRNWVSVSTTGGPPTPRNASSLTTDPVHGSAILLGPPDWNVGPNESDYAWILK